MIIHGAGDSRREESDDGGGEMKPLLAQIFISDEPEAGHNETKTEVAC